MPLNGVPESVRGRTFDIEFTVKEAVSGNETWELKWKNQGPEFVAPEGAQSSDDVIQRAGLAGVPIDFDNDVLICRGMGDVFEERAGNPDEEPPLFSREITEFITKFKVRLIPADEASMVLNTLWYGGWLEDPVPFFNTLFKYTDDKAVPLWAGICWYSNASKEYDEAGLPAIKELILTPYHEDEEAMDRTQESQPYNIWLDAWRHADHPEVTRDFEYPAIVLLRSRESE